MAASWAANEERGGEARLRGEGAADRGEGVEGSEGMGVGGVISGMVGLWRGMSSSRSSLKKRRFLGAGSESIGTRPRSRNELKETTRLSNRGRFFWEYGWSDEGDGRCLL